ncbi:hypothetical protein P7C70_g1864, partial [Phenoliferia sp. Uapishka_3]
MSGSNSTVPSLTSSSSSDQSDPFGNTSDPIWKYAVVVVVVVLAFIAISRVIFVRRARLRRSTQTGHPPSSYPISNSNSPDLPPYTINSPQPRGGILSTLLGIRPSVSPRSRDEESRVASPNPHCTPESEARARLRQQEIRQALQDAGLLTSPRASLRTRDAVEVEVERRLRRERRERRERRRERRKAAEEELGLPAYTKEKGEGEKVLIEREADDDSEGDDSEDENHDSKRVKREVEETPSVAIKRGPEVQKALADAKNPDASSCQHKPARLRRVKLEVEEPTGGTAVARVPTDLTNQKLQLPTDRPTVARMKHEATEDTKLEKMEAEVTAPEVIKPEGEGAGGSLDVNPKLAIRKVKAEPTESSVAPRQEKRLDVKLRGVDVNVRRKSHEVTIKSEPERKPTALELSNVSTASQASRRKVDVASKRTEEVHEHHSPVLVDTQKLGKPKTVSKSKTKKTGEPLVKASTKLEPAARTSEGRRSVSFAPVTDPPKKGKAPRPSPPVMPPAREREKLTPWTFSDDLNLIMSRPRPETPLFKETKLVLGRWTSAQFIELKRRHRHHPNILDNITSLEIHFISESDLQAGERMATTDAFAVISGLPALVDLQLFDMTERPFLSDSEYFEPMKRVLSQIITFKSTGSLVRGALDHVLPHLRSVTTLSFNPFDVSATIPYPLLRRLEKLTLQSRNYVSEDHEDTPSSPELVDFVQQPHLVSLRLSSHILHTLISLRQSSSTYPIQLPARLNIIIDIDNDDNTWYDRFLPRSGVVQLHFTFTSKYTYSPSFPPSSVFKGMPNTITWLSWTISRHEWEKELYIQDLDFIDFLRSREPPRLPNLKRIALHVPHDPSWDELLPNRGPEEYKGYAGCTFNDWAAKFKVYGIALTAIYKHTELE